MNCFIRLYEVKLRKISFNSNHQLKLKKKYKNNLAANSRVKFKLNMNKSNLKYNMDKNLRFRGC